MMTKHCEFGDGTSAILTYSGSDTYWDEKSYKKPFKTITVDVETGNRIMTYWNAGRLEHILVCFNEMDRSMNNEYFGAKVGAVYDISDDTPSDPTMKLMIVFKVMKPKW